MLAALDHAFAGVDGLGGEGDVSFDGVVVAGGDDADARLGRGRGGEGFAGGFRSSFITEGGLTSGKHLSGKCGGFDAGEGSAEIGDFLGSFIDEEDDDLDVGVVSEEGGGDVLEEGGFAGLGWGDDEGALAAADGAEEVDEAAGGWAAGVFEGEAGLGVDGGEVFEGDEAVWLGEGVAIDVEVGRRGGWGEGWALVAAVVGVGVWIVVGVGVAVFLEARVVGAGGGMGLALVAALGALGEITRALVAAAGLWLALVLTGAWAGVRAGVLTLV